MKILKRINSKKKIKREVQILSNVVNRIKLKAIPTCTLDEVVKNLEEKNIKISYKD